VLGLIASGRTTLIPQEIDGRTSLDLNNQTLVDYRKADVQHYCNPACRSDRREGEAFAARLVIRERFSRIPK
jgi:hypothetical protein